MKSIIKALLILNALTLAVHANQSENHAVLNKIYRNSFSLGVVVSGFVVTSFALKWYYNHYFKEEIQKKAIISALNEYLISDQSPSLKMRETTQDVALLNVVLAESLRNEENTGCSDMLGQVHTARKAYLSEKTKDQYCLLQHAVYNFCRSVKINEKAVIMPALHKES